MLAENIQTTVNVPYEIVLIDNSTNKYSIFEAYNEGVQRAIHPYLCFIHEDIMFRTDNVGKLLLSSFSTNPNLGLIGVIGIQVLPEMCFGWWTAGYDYYVGDIIKNKKRKRMTPGYTHLELVEPKLKKAVACDGLFLGIPRALFDKISWDVNTFKGFHCYDLDICMQVLAAGYDINILENLRIEHYSTGNPSEAFAHEMVVFNNKWREKLPVATQEIEQATIHDIQESVYAGYITSMPLAIRYKHLTANPMGRLLIDTLRKIKNKLNR